MIKVMFTWHEKYGQEVEEEFEFEDDITEEGIQKEYELWLFELIGDRTGWHYM